MPSVQLGPRLSMHERSFHRAAAACDLQHSQAPALIPVHIVEAASHANGMQCAYEPKLVPLLLPAPDSSQKHTLKLYVYSAGGIYREIRLLAKTMFFRLAK